MANLNEIKALREIFSTRVVTCLLRIGIHSAKEIKREHLNTLLDLNSFGWKSYKEVRKYLGDVGMGITLRSDLSKFTTSDLLTEATRRINSCGAGFSKS